MEVVKTSKKGIDYIEKVLAINSRSITKSFLWGIHHTSGAIDASLKIQRENKITHEKNEITLQDKEFTELINFLKDNYTPFKLGEKKYIPLGENISLSRVEDIKLLFNNPNKSQLINFILENEILPEEMVDIVNLNNKKRSIKKFEEMLDLDLDEKDWQVWFKSNPWVLGSDHIELLDEREIDTSHIADYLTKAYDGFLDIIEIKSPKKELKFWAENTDHGNYFPHSDLVKAITQSQNYIFEVEGEINSNKFRERVGNIKIIKPRCILVFGRSTKWNEQQKEAYRILNCSYHDLTILTYDHILLRAKNILGS